MWSYDSIHNTTFFASTPDRPTFYLFFENNQLLQTPINIAFLLLQNLCTSRFSFDCPVCWAESHPTLPCTWYRDRESAARAGRPGVLCCPTHLSLRPSIYVWDSAFNHKTAQLLPQLVSLHCHFEEPIRFCPCLDTAVHFSTIEVLQAQVSLSWKLLKKTHTICSSQNIPASQSSWKTFHSRTFRFLS